MVRVKVRCETEEKHLSNQNREKLSTDKRHPFLWVQQEMAYGFDAGQHADVSGEVCGLEDGLVLPLKVQVHHQRLQLLTNDPRFVFHVPAVRTTDTSDVVAKP